MRGWITGLLAAGLCLSAIGQLYISNPFFVAGVLKSSATAWPGGISTAPSVWLAARKESFSDNDAVTTATDWSGNARHATQDEAGKKPTFKTSAFGSLPTFRFDGGDNLQITSLGITTFSVFLVVSNSASGMLVEHADTSVDPNDGFYIYGTTGCSINVRKSATQGNKDNNISSWSVQNRMLIRVDYDGTYAGTTMRTNDVAVSLIACANANDAGTGSVTQTLNIGGRADATSLNITGHIAEMVLYTPALSGSDADAVENDLMSVYALP